MFTPERKPPQSKAPNVQWKARKYRFADGEVYRSNVYLVLYPGADGIERTVGGAVVTSTGRTLAFIGTVAPRAGRLRMRVLADGLVAGDRQNYTRQLRQSRYPPGGLPSAGTFSGLATLTAGREKSKGARLRGRPDGEN